MRGEIVKCPCGKLGVEATLLTDDGFIDVVRHGLVSVCLKDDGDLSPHIASMTIEELETPNLLVQVERR